MVDRSQLPDPRRYCPLNTKGRGDNQAALFDEDLIDYDIGLCKIDYEKCHYEKCSTFALLINSEEQHPAPTAEREP